MKLLLSILLIAFTAFITVQKATAQYDEKDFVLYSVKNGLSSNEVTSLQQDNHGYMWVATKAGLNRFDGTGFEKFYQGNRPVQLPSDIITRLKKISPNELGILTRGGFILLNTDNYKTTRFIISDSTAFSRPLNAVWDATPVSPGRFAISTAAGFYVVTEKGSQFRHDGFLISDIGRKQILFGREIFPLEEKKFMVYVNEDEQWLYDATAENFKPWQSQNKPYNALPHPHRFPGDRWIVKKQLNLFESLYIPLKADSIIYYNSKTLQRVASPLPVSFYKQLGWESQLLPVGDSILLLNSGVTGFYKLHIDHRTGKIIGNETKFLPNYAVKSLLTDSEGRLWAGTSKGLLKQSLVAQPIASFEYEPSDTVSGSGAFSCVYRYKNFLYAGQYSRNYGLSIIDPVTMKRIRQVSFFGKDLPWNEVMSIEMYHTDTLWIGTYAGILWYDTKSNSYGKLLDEKKYPWAANFPAILAPPGKNGDAWFCAFLDGRLVRYHIPSRSFTLFSPQTKPALPFEKIKSIVYDAYGDVWISGHALARWNNRLQRFDTLIKVYAGINKFNEDILTISADDKGSLWLHNTDNGLLEYNVQQKKFSGFDSRQAAGPLFIHALSRVINGKLWMACNNQLCLLNTNTRQLTFYNQDDGLNDITPSSRRIYFDATDSNMIICAENTLMRFPLNPKQKPNNEAQLLIESMSINNDSILFFPSGKIELPYHKNNLGFRFSIVDFERNNYRFSYRINNDTTWTAIGSQRQLSFSNLSPGQYTIEWSAVGKSGEQKTTKLIIVIHAPFWKQAWFIACGVLLLIVLLFLFFRNRLKKIRQKAIIDKQLSLAQMQALQAQMNPHFIFNSLNSIREMILSNENKDASHYLGRFAQLIRITLEQSALEEISLRATINYLSRYIEMETIRNGLLQYEIVADETIDQDECMLSPMIIQPFVENAIWHGVSASSKKLLLKISFRVEGTSLVCIINDNGIGINQAMVNKKGASIQTRSHGISNVKERLALLSEKFDQPFSVTITDKKDMPGEEGPGTIVTIVLPYQINEQ